jgi:hypothetical protein
MTEAIDQQTHPPAPRRSFFPACRRDVAWVVVFIVCAGSLQLLMPYPFDADTGYHFAVGRLVREHGFLHSFPWTPFSWLSDRYADKELLFHLLFVPLANIDFVTASRIVGTLCGAGILSAIYFILRAERIQIPGIWSLFTLAASASFTFRFALVRPHLLSISLALLLLWAAVRCRLRLLAAVSSIYPWAYVAFWQIPLLLLVAAETGRFFSARKIEWRPALVVALGIAGGLALHPNLGNLLHLNWIQMSIVLLKNAWGAQGGFDLGTEFNPPSLATWGMKLMLAVLMTVAALASGWRQRSSDPLPLVFALAALGFGILTARTSRFVEYFVPLATVAGALASQFLTYRFIPPAALTVGIVYTLLLGSNTYVRLARRGADIPPALAEELRSAIPSGAQIFTPDWQLTGSYMMALPERRFIVALDPTFFYVKDPDLYRTWYRISRDAPPDLTDIIRQRFNARYVLFFDRPDFARLLFRLASDRKAKLLLRTRIMYLFDIGEPAGGTKGS